MTAVLFVPVHRFFQVWMELSDLEPFVERAWPITQTKAGTADRVVAVFNAPHWTQARPIAAWRLRAAFDIPGTSYKLSNGEQKKRTGLSLGGPLPLLDEYLQLSFPNFETPRVIDVPVSALESERD